MKIISYTTHHLVKSEDLNHHGTLFAGRSAEWFVESAFIAASTLLKPKNILCRKIHSLSFMRPVYPGSTVCLRSRVVYTGRSSIVVYVDFFLINDFNNLIANGYVTFVNVDENAKPLAHGITLDLTNDEERKLSDTAANFKKE
ncbi:MAG TPA: hotdog domain-containing protein [Clostridiales bacterium]|nr:hotdog domain-containing protein [Clostridiales bacterium]